MGNKKGRKVVEFGENGYEVEGEDGDWSHLIQQIRENTAEERHKMEVGETIEFEEDGIVIRKVSHDNFELVVRGSSLQRGLAQINKKIGSVVDRLGR